MKKIIYIFVLIITSVTVASEVATTPYKALVVTAKVEKGMINAVQTFNGTLFYNTKSNIASEVEGIVEAYFFQEGQSVEKGTILTSLDSKILSASIMAKSSMLKAMKADLTRQEKEFERSSALFERESISQSSYDIVLYKTQEQREQLKAMQSELDAMNIQKSKTHIRAPFDAVIIKRDVQVGQWIARGASIATLVEPQSIEARVNIPANLMQNIYERKTFLAHIDTKELEISLKSIIPIADSATRTFPLIFNIPKGINLIEGMAITIDIPTQKKIESLLVPRDAVIKRFGSDVVFAVVDEKAMMIPVKILGYKTDTVSIEADGLSEHMRVIIKGNERISPNTPTIERVN